MKWLVDIDAAVSDGTLSNDAGRVLKKRAHEAMIDYAINITLFTGVAMVIGGAVAWLDDRRALGSLGLLLTVLGALALLRGGSRVRPVANATAIIGAALAIGAFAILLFEDRPDRIGVGAMLGLPSVALGYVLFRFGPKDLGVLGGWILILGSGVHVAGILLTESDLNLGWLVLHYAGAVAIACGLVLDVRFVTAISIVPLAAALSSRTFYNHALYGVAIYESTLTFIQMCLFALLALAISQRSKKRTARHSRLMGHLCLIWANMALWVGSLWDDTVGFYLWGPDWNVVTQGLDNWQDKYEAWRKAVDSFTESALIVPSEFFVILWAAGILAVGIWAAFTARRGVLNIVVTFGAVHFYTQYFEHLNLTPSAFVIAGVIAIISAWAMWGVNKRMARHQGTK